MTANFETVLTVDDLRVAIEQSRGDLTRASELLHRSRRHVMRLLARHGLNEWARGLREANGQPGKGRPRRKSAA